jgi:hypothetical protein
LFGLLILVETLTIIVYENKRYKRSSQNTQIEEGFLFFYFWCFNATFSNISAISWRPILVVEDAGVPEENHRPWASNW